MGQTALTIVHYVWLHINLSAPYLIRNTDHPETNMGAESIAKRCLKILEQLGIDTAVYKSHSLRGATATHLAQSVVPLHWIQGRGGWSSLETLQKHYNSLHQKQNWEALLTSGGAPSGGNRGRCNTKLSCSLCDAFLSGAEERRRKPGKRTQSNKTGW